MLNYIMKLFWKRCHYCGKKKEYFFWLWETPFYDDAVDYTADELEICTDCTQKKIEESS